MGNHTAVGAEKKFIIRLVGIRQGTQIDTLVLALQELFKGKTAVEIERALERLPLVLSRSTTEDKARQIKLFLEAQGAILRITYSASAIIASPKENRRPGIVPGREAVKTVKGVPAEMERSESGNFHPVVEVHPSGIGGILDRSLRFLRRYFGFSARS